MCHVLRQVLHDLRCHQLTSIHTAIFRVDDRMVPRPDGRSVLYHSQQNRRHGGYRARLRAT